MASQPVVALESTIIAHGMPYPANVETALAVERVILGLSPDQIERLATSPGVLIAAPIPACAALPAGDARPAIPQALAQCA